MTDQTWRVVGGSQGGILVREGQDLKSPEAPARLAKGAVVRELELQGERLRYELLSGEGPQRGWVSLTLKGSNLLKRHGQVPAKPREVDFRVSAPPAPADARGRVVWALADGGRDSAEAFAALGAGLRLAGYRVRVFAERRWRALVAAAGLDFTEAGLSDEDVAQGIGQVEGVDMPPSLLSYRHKAKAVIAEAEESPPDLVLYEIGLMSVAMAVNELHGVGNYPVWLRLPDPQSVLQFLWLVDEVVGEVAGVMPIRSRSIEELMAEMIAPRMLIASSPLELEAFTDEAAKQQYTFTHKSLFTGYWHIPEEAQLELGDALQHGVHSEVEAFMKAGKAPVYVAWGESTVEGWWAVQSAVSAIKAGGFRAIVVAGKAGLSEELLRTTVGEADSEGLLRYAKANVLFTSAVPLAWALPKCCCAMVTGGPGVIGACLHAALPVLVSPADGPDQHFAGWVKALGVGASTAFMAELELAELTASIKLVATDSKIAGRAKEVQKQVKQELGVTAAVLGVNALMKNEVLSGANKRAWQEKRRIIEEAAETDEEPTDGVLRPPPAAASKKPAANKVLPATPSWLKPDGKGKILIFTIPLKGHIIHLIRIAQWFLEHPGYEVTVVCSEASISDVPKGANIITYKHTDSFSKMDELLAKQAHLDEDEVTEEATPGLAQDGDDMFDIFQKMLGPIAELKPNVFVTDQALAFIPYPNLIPATCKVFKAKCLLIVSPSIKENRIRQYKAMAKLAKSSTKKPKKPVESDSQKEEGNTDESKAPGAVTMDENGLPELPWKPESISIFRMVQIFRAIPSISAEPPIFLYPSSGVLHGAARHDNELFTGAFVPLPEPVDGAVQFGRAGLSMEPGLLDWLFASEDPVVYVAFGTIVSKFLPSTFVRPLVEALDGGPWRVLLVLPQALHKHLPELPGARWRVESFAPQGEILRCERVRCFISHCGANSTMEAMACGVPLVCMPFYMDQFDWSWAVRRHCRAAVQVSCHSAPAAIRAAVSEVLADEAYRESARQVALRMAQQADAVLDWLGPGMRPKARLGPGVSVTAAIMVGLMKGEDVRPIFGLVDQALPP